MKKYIMIAVAAIIYSIGIALLLEPAHLVTGGVTGISIALNILTKIETGTWILLLNIPILLTGAYVLGIRFIVSTVWFIVLSSVFTNLLSRFSANHGLLTQDLLISALFGGALVAVGMGISLKAGATTGGTDVIIKMIRLHYPQIKTSSFVLAFDVAIITLGVFVLKDITMALYAVVSVVTTTLVLDRVLYGKDEARQYFVISSKSEEISKRLREELATGVTHLYAHGGQTSQNEEVLLCVIKKSMSAKLEEIIKETDPKCFLIVGNASEIYGEGYKSLYSEKY